MSSITNDPTIKPVRLTGAAAAEVSGLTKNKRRASKKGGNEGDRTSSSPPAPFSPPSPSSPSAPAPAPPASPAPAPPAPPAPSPLLPSPASTAASPAPPAPTSTTPQAEGGAKTIRVELKKRTSTKKVHLQPKGVKKNPSPASAPASSSSPAKKTRKVTLAVKSLHKRMSRAKKMTRKVKEMSLPQLREHLIQKKLIKPTSKAPETILRQIAADAQIVAGKAL